MMMRTIFYIVPLALALAAAGYSGQSKQFTAGVAGSSASAASKVKSLTSVEGQLLSTDEASESLTIQTAEGELMHFYYTPETKVAGMRESAEGLAQSKGSVLKVEYVAVYNDPETHGETARNVAVKIERAASPVVAAGSADTFEKIC